MKAQAYRGIVVEGQKLGRELGVPTANIPLEGHTDLERGVFAAEVDRPGTRCAPAMAYIGSRPSVDGNDGAAPVLEVHILDFDGDLYGVELSVRLLAKVRDEAKLDSLEALRVRIAENLARVRDHFGLMREDPPTGS